MRTSSSTVPAAPSLSERRSFAANRCRPQKIYSGIAITVVVAVEEAPFLVPIQRVVGGVEVERDLCRRLVVGIEEQINEQPFHGAGVGGDLVVAAPRGGGGLPPGSRGLS